MRFKDTQLSYTFSLFIMTYETAISALDAARTGDELLRTLDTLDGDLPLVVDYGNVATLEPMEF
jgi:hypothetical protein